MDVDISDILASVSRPVPAARYDPTTPSTPYYDDNTAFTDHQLLTRAWTSERCAPDLLPYPTELLGRVMERVQAQIARIEDLAAGAGVGDGSSNGGVGNVNLVLSILQTDLSRTQFLVRSLLRQRLSKLTRFAGYYTSVLDADRKDDVVAREAGRAAAGGLLSGTEAQFLRGHQALLKGFYEGSFLTGFPQKLRRLDDGGTGEGGMQEGPDLLQVVVVRCLGERWGNEERVDAGEEGVSTVLEMERGQVWVVRWGDVRGGVGEGALEVL
ncbi:uncharacterized protein HMPREF1541_05761 [Cyphellophora europaea CBS 101466]|uniref:DNA replication complex GINS protein SLD5 n=1 Tax=Cyphellophora europaea (strain CBS 101466) TaxID=1220924 RepID=W2RT90_CYPE1|nr:uncharacterized protein HMPREF1541_05761 [Cyphellophora europaea CBS 101466]ETN39535.1 hypothetical protein HMPREF1541_05761 [Cyphellophora europaea CBS 101466]